MADLVVRNAHLVDGTGSPGRPADVVVDEGQIVAIEAAGAASTAGARQVVDADGRLVTPGFVDVHTHYDAQVTWDPYVTPSSWHGVTTVVMGNCGVGFAPARADRHEWLIDLMEGVEDIPGSAMTEGITWEWTSFPEYLDAVERTPRVLDVGAQIAHGPLRGYVAFLEDFIPNGTRETSVKTNSMSADDIVRLYRTTEDDVLMLR